MRVAFASQPAHPDRPNEDFIGATADAVVLLDGASIPPGVTSTCSHSVRWYSHTLGSTLLAEMTQSAGPLPELLAQGIKRVTSLHDFTCDLTHGGSPSATVIMLRHTADHLDWLVLGDSTLILDTGTPEPMVICDDRLEQVAAPHRVRLDSLPVGTPEHAEARREYVETLGQYRNRDGGFWVASTDPLAADQALTGTIPTGQVHAAALVTDGATDAVSRYRLITWRQLLNVLTQDGPTGLIGRVREAERSDPHGERWPRSKTHDDATAANVMVHE
ncbi:protein phosphatase 2C domain-containing protein [Microbispora sp. NEAU-D428]|uniref:protein phosphatase 2C domain-containing protein n=1 Tax=Microbispora sitophila TaxID=2771537 RepID=UPI001866489E|nr:protein phosphatase 2C domain-containing protein [Microbispora sitophila]MBE3008361.1 protein phosphatase 2C domain-containing protein [Microbispora sitophila]